VSVHRCNTQRKKAYEVNCKGAFQNVIHDDFSDVPLGWKPIRFVLANELKEKLNQEKWLKDEHCDHYSFSFTNFKCVSKANQWRIEVGRYDAKSTHEDLKYQVDGVSMPNYHAVPPWLLLVLHAGVGKVFFFLFLYLFLSFLVAFLISFFVAFLHL
jgi:hypothetical protein